MIINTNNYSISEILGMLQRRELSVNREYQRGSGIWPSGARSYFIDTILNGFPFPKIYLFEFTDRADGFALKRELVDGQQRISSIQDFRTDKFRISGESAFKGHNFSSLDQDTQDRFLAYTVSADVIRNASRAEILQMFRRMNAYTLPLNEAEKRHSSFDGEFKWFVNETADSLNTFLVEFGVFTNRQIVRMADAELITEIVLSFNEGMVSSSPALLKEVYKKFDENFERRAAQSEAISNAFRFVGENLQALKRTHLMKPYALHTLIVGLVHNRYGIDALARQLRVQGSGQFCVSVEQTEQKLLELAEAHEANELESDHAAYVWGASGGTNRLARRIARVAEVMRALGNPVEVELDANLIDGMPTAIRQASEQVAFGV